MSSATLSSSASHAHEHFLAALPAMERAIRFQLHRFPKHFRAEALAEALAACWHAWQGLVNRGKDPRAVGPTGIAANSVRYVLNDRKLGTGSVGRGAMDLLDRRAQRAGQFQVFSLDHQTGTAVTTDPVAWRDWIAEDNRVTPADEAAFRVDFEAWLNDLPTRKRQMAELLVEGHETGVVATMLNVTPGAVSQTRAWLEASWRAFQGEAGRKSAGHR